MFLTHGCLSAGAQNVQGFAAGLKEGPPSGDEVPENSGTGIYHQIKAALAKFGRDEAPWGSDEVALATEALPQGAEALPNCSKCGLF
jgi:hypothetical protein